MGYPIVVGMTGEKGKCKGLSWLGCSLGRVAGLSAALLTERL